VLGEIRTGHQLNKGTCFTIVARFLDKICAQLNMCINVGVQV
jgi:hypothetical protein